jgi:hypothetical protein
MFSSSHQESARARTAPGSEVGTRGLSTAVCRLARSLRAAPHGATAPNTGAEVRTAGHPRRGRGSGGCGQDCHGFPFFHHSSVPQQHAVIGVPGRGRIVRGVHHRDAGVGGLPDRRADRRCASARASSTRCRCPPDRVSRRRPARSVISIRVRQSATIARSARVIRRHRPRCAQRPMATVSPTVMGSVAGTACCWTTSAGRYPPIPVTVPAVGATIPPRQGGFSGAVGAQQRRDLPTRHHRRDLVQYRVPRVTRGQPGDLDSRRAHSVTPANSL